MNKRIIFLAAILFLLTLEVFAQQLLKIPVSTNKDPGSQSPYSSIIKLVDMFNKNKIDSSLTNLKSAIGNEAKSEDTVFKNWLSKIEIQVSKLKDSSILVKGDIIVETPPKASGSEGRSSKDRLGTIASLTMKKLDNSGFEVAFVDTDDGPIGGFVVKQLNEQLFYEEIRKSLLNFSTATVPPKSDSIRVDSLIANFKKRTLYEHMLEASLQVNDDEVFAGELTIRRDIYMIFEEDLSALTNTEKKVSLEKLPTMSTENALKVAIAENAIIPSFNYTQKILPFTAHNVQIQFQDGFIENIIVRGKIAGESRLLKFENSFPIPFSTRRDFRRLSRIAISEKTAFNSIHTNQRGIKRAKIRIGDLLDFNQNIDVDTKDYSPVNHVYKSDLKAAETYVNLPKERTSKILELRVYTDLKGIESESPNGLVQFELMKKMNLWNNREFFLRKAWNFGNIGFLNSITPSFAMNKIEDKNKRLPVSYIGTQFPDTTKVNSFASSLSLFQYQTFRVGLDLSLITIDIPGLKSIFSLKSGFYFGRTLTVDTLRIKIDSATFEPVKDNNVIESGVNSIQMVPELSMQIYPDKRYGITVSQKFSNYKILARSLKQVTDSINYTQYIQSLKGDRSMINNYPSNRWLATSELFAFYRPAPYSQIFFRYRYNWDMSQAKVNFHQLQLGISTYLTHTRKGKKETDIEYSER